MKSLFVLFSICAFVSYSLAECPAGEYYPGEGCSFEDICPIPSAHSAREHYCDCWCNPGLIRDSVTKTCVEKCPNYKPLFEDNLV